MRDDDWLVTKVDMTSNGTLVTAQGLSELVRETTAQFSAGIDTIVPVDPRNTTMVTETSKDATTCGRGDIAAKTHQNLRDTNDPDRDVAQLFDRNLHDSDMFLYSNNQGDSKRTQVHDAPTHYRIRTLPTR